VDYVQTPPRQRRQGGRVRAPVSINRNVDRDTVRRGGQDNEVAGALAGLGDVAMIDERIVAVETIAVGAAAMAAVGMCAMAGMAFVTICMTGMPGGRNGFGTVAAVEVAHRGQRARRQPDGHPERGRKRPPPALPMANLCLPAAFVSH